MTTQNKNNTAMIATPQFVLETINPSVLNIHPMLVEMSYDHKPDANYIKTMNIFNHYEKPVIDCNNNIITHCADVLTAIENDLPAIEVYRVDLTEDQMRMFISFKHTYSKQNIIATYKTIKFYEDYLTKDNQGIEFATTIPFATTREKIAALMQTSDSTVKRVKEVGDKKPEKLGLIQEDLLSMKDVLDEIKKDDLTNKPKVKLNEKFDENDDLDIDQMNSTKNINLTKGSFHIEGVGDVEISVDQNKPSLKLNGAAVKHLTYNPIVNSYDSKTTGIMSFGISQKGHKGMSIQVIIENFSLAA